MIRSPRRSAGRSRIVLAALVAAGGVVLAGCHAGQQAQTAEQRPTIDGTDAQVGSLALRGMLIEYPEGGRYAQGDDARLRMVVVNESRDADALVEARTDAAERVTFAPAAAEPTASAAAGAAQSGTATATGTASPTASPGPPQTQAPAGGTSPETTARIEIPPNSAVTFRDSGPAVTLVGLTRELRAAEIVRITLVFAKAGAVTADVAVAVPLSPIPPAPTVGTEHGGEG